jgi:hypothetical protein
MMTACTLVSIAACECFKTGLNKMLQDNPTVPTGCSNMVSEVFLMGFPYEFPSIFEQNEQGWVIRQGTPTIVV